MKTDKPTLADITRSVMSVPPLAATADLSIDTAQNHKIIRHIEAGGIRTLLYAGNANVYNLDIARYEAMLDVIESGAGADSWVIPGIGPDFGKALDQARLLAKRKFPVALTLPTNAAVNPSGVEKGMKLVADAMGKPLILYVKTENYITPAAIGRMVESGHVFGIKYAIERKDPQQDAYLAELVKTIDPKRIVSGMGERPAVAHLQRFGVGGFTSGLVCVTPAVVLSILQAAQAGDFDKANRIAAAFKPLEDIREKMGFIRVLHAVLRMAGVADTGPVIPILGELDAAEEAQVAPLLETFLGTAKAA
ncbi:dihydrodipicolinate synthase family protein [Lacibacterium aquatile]|uniref:Dihydrodipicolinate synthase family protein n=1 Tax=Lacibacterium aquatile TaxID=1168082 RepID=A0ABW5DRJ9_9PROT